MATSKQTARAKQAKQEAPLRDGTVSAGAIQMHDLSPVGRQVVNAQMRSAGQTIRERNDAAQERASLTAVTPGGSAANKKKAGVLANTYDTIGPHLRNRTITPASAANVRSGFYDRAIQSATDRGRSVPDGAGWYFDHHRDIAKVAKETGHDASKAVIASAVMSPQNSPDNEKSAINAMMRAHADGSSVTIHPRVAAHLRAAKVDVPDHLVGQAVHPSQLPHGALAALSGANIRDHVEHTGFDLKDISRGGTKANVTAAHGVLSGQIPREQAPNMHPISAPKVNSYAANIHDSHPGSAVHDEYMFRVQHHAGVVSGRVHPEQTYADVHGLSGSKEGVLSPTRNTAEDTWMNAMTFNQPNVTPAKKTSVFKSGGSNYNYPAIGKKAEVGGEVRSGHTDGRVGANALQHAFNNKATIDAAAKQSRRTDPAGKAGYRPSTAGGHTVHAGVDLPSIAVQEVAWTQARRETGKDPEWNQSQSTAPLSRQMRGQGRLF